MLDPKAVYGDDFPGETFRVLKENEIRKYGEYRTQRLVLFYYRAWRDGEIDEFNRWLSSGSERKSPPLGRALDDGFAGATTGRTGPRGAR